MRIAIGVISFFGLAACSTVQSRRDDPPILDQLSAVSVGDFQTCFAAQVADGRTPTYTPRGNDGGSYVLTEGNDLNPYVRWVVDIDDLGTERRVRVFAPDSIRGPQREIMEKVRACI